MHKLEDRIIEMGQFGYIYSFLCTVKGSNKQKLKDKLIQTLKSDPLTILSHNESLDDSECVLSSQEHDQLILEFKKITTDAKKLE